MVVRLSTLAIAELENAFRSGLSASAAARRVRCAQTSANNYFAEFAGDCIPRGVRAPNPGNSIVPPPPRYTGPAIIGKRITAPTRPEGSGWIG